MVNDMQPRIKSYDFGKMFIDGETHTRDLIITPKGIIGNWWRKEGHRLQLDDIKHYVPEDLDYDAVVIGTGYYGYMVVDKDVIEYFENKGVEVYVLDTRKAVKKYNELVDKGKKVLGLFHLTC